MNRFIASFLLTGALVVLNTSAFAQGAGAGLGAQSLWGNIQSGDYNFFHYSGSQVEAQKLDAAFSRAESDRQFFMNYVKSVNESMDRLVSEVVMGVQSPSDQKNNRPVREAELDASFMGLSQNYGAQGKMVPPGVFLNVVRKYNSQRNALVNLISGFASLPKAAEASRLSLNQVSDRAGQQVLEIPQWGNLNLKEIEADYLGKLEALDQVVTTQIKLTIGTFTGGAVVSIPDAEKFKVMKLNSLSSLVLDPKTLNLDFAEVQKLQDQAMAYRKFSMEERNRVNAFTAFAKSMVQRFIETYGSSERYRKQDGRANNIEGFKSFLKDLTEVFWARSFLRAEYGLSLGVIGVQYQKMIFNADYLLEKTTLKFFSDPITTQGDMNAIEQSIRNALNLMDMRAKALTTGGKAKQTEWDLGGVVKADQEASTEDILQKNVGLAGKATSFLIWASGNRALANANLQVLRLLALDLYEEKEMIKGNLRGVNLSYMRRYFADEDDKKYFAELEQRFDPSGEKKSAQEDNADIFGDSTTMVAGTVYGEVKPILNVAVQRQAKLMQARNIEAEVELLLKVKDSAEQNKQKGRRDYRRGLLNSTTNSVSPGR